MSESITLYGGNDLCFALTFFIIPDLCFIMATEHQMTFQCKSLSQQQKISPDWQQLSQCTLYMKVEFFPPLILLHLTMLNFISPFFLLFQLFHKNLLQFFLVRPHPTLNNLVSSPNFLISLLTLLCRSLITILSRTIPCTYYCGILLLISLHWEN